MSTGTSRRPKANSSTQAAVLRPTPGSAHEVVARLLQRRVAQPVERQLVGPGPCGSSAIARRIAWMRADLTFEMPPGRIASSTSATGASRTCLPATGSALAQRAGRRRRGCGRWWTARAPSGSARRSGGRAGPSAGCRRPRAGGRARAARARGGAAASAAPRRRLVAAGVTPAPYSLAGLRGILAACPRSEHGRVTTGEIDGMPVFWRSAPCRGGGTPRRCTCTACRRTPTTGSPFLARTGGVAPDLPGFGRSGKPGYLRVHDRRSTTASSSASSTSAASSA